MPESSEVMKRQKYYSSDSSYDSSSGASESEDNEKEEYQNKNREKQVVYNLKQSNNYKLIQQSSKLISSNFIMWRIMERKLLNSIKDFGPNEPLSCVREPGLHPTSFPNLTWAHHTIPSRGCKWKANRLNEGSLRVLSSVFHSFC